jgi:hypothetical protein
MHTPNKQLLARIQSEILSNPARFNIEDFTSDIMGLAVAAFGIDPDQVDCATKGRELLRISAAQRDALCLLHLWPSQFRQRFEPEPSSARELRSNARVASERINYFIQAGC